MATILQFFDARITLPEVWRQNITGPMALPREITVRKIRWFREQNRYLSAGIPLYAEPNSSRSAGEQ
jgi:hypothetical protein